MPSASVQNPETPDSGKPPPSESEIHHRKTIQPIESEQVIVECVCLYSYLNKINMWAILCVLKRYVHKITSFFQKDGTSPCKCM